MIPTATMVLDPADQVCRTVTFVLLVVIEDEYEQIDGSALHHEYMDLIWACQCLTMPAMLQTSITPAHKHTHYWFLKTRENCRSHSRKGDCVYANILHFTEAKDFVPAVQTESQHTPL